MEFQNALRRTWQADLCFDGEPDRVFPLLCPVREYDWIPGWACTMVHSQSGVAEAGAIFRTSFPDVGDEVWTISRYEPPRRIEFVRVSWDVVVVKMEIVLEPAGDGRTRARWSHAFTSLGPAGDRVLAARTDEAHAGEVRSLEAMMNHWLATGRRMAERPAGARPRDRQTA